MFTEQTSWITHLTEGFQTNFKDFDISLDHNEESFFLLTQPIYMYSSVYLVNFEHAIAVWENSASKFFLLTTSFLIVYCEHLGHSVSHYFATSNINISLKQFNYYLRMFKIGTIYISIFYWTICSQLLLFYFPEVVSMNTFLNDVINIFCWKHLKSNFYTKFLLFMYIN